MFSYLLFFLVDISKKREELPSFVFYLMRNDHVIRTSYSMMMIMIITRDI